ncbi:MAG: cardiolipin synthase [Lachnospiraceae bacterium]|nr:cardiolipin synthase [Lachnospiraceae bacterium]
MEQNDFFRLAAPRKKGILSLIFSRFFVFALLIALQVFLIVYFYIWLDQYLSWFRIALTLFTFIMIVYLFNSSMDASGKLSWMLFIAVLPIPGAAMLWFTQRNYVHRNLKKRVNALINETWKSLPKRQAVLDELHKDNSCTDDLCRYLNLSGCFPVYDRTETVYFPSGEAKFEAMLAELEKAEQYIFLEYFIIEEGYMWGEILKILIEKAQAGLDVRVMYDGMNEMSTLPSYYWKLLENEGIKAKPFAPITPIVSSHYNYRDHRKILVIDGKTGFSGGVNLADEYINKKKRFGHWKDVAVMLKGDAVLTFTLLFLQMWNVSEREAVFDPYLRESFDPPAHPSGYVMPYGDSPMDGDKVGEMVYIDILNRAHHYVHIMTPYLILDGELEAALKFAAQRDIDIKIILPGIPDKKAAYALAKSHYKSLLNAGVKIYEYTPGFVHAKLFTSDDVKGVTGTINLDYRSLYHHFECAVYLYKADCIKDMEADFQETLAKCREVTLETVKNEKLSYKIAGTLLRFIAPLM